MAPPAPSAPIAARPSATPSPRPPALATKAPHAPDEVAAAILSELPQDRLAAATARLIELADQPEAAVELARTLCRLDPDFVREHGSTLITVLTETRNYPAALHFAKNGGPERTLWLELTFARWAEVEPRRAAEAALANPDPEGFSIVCHVWSARDPAGFSTFLRELPPLSASAQAAFDASNDLAHAPPARAL